MLGGRKLIPALEWDDADEEETQRAQVSRFSLSTLKGKWATAKRTARQHARMTVEDRRRAFGMKTVRAVQTSFKVLDHSKDMTPLLRRNFTLAQRAPEPVLKPITVDQAALVFKKHQLHVKVQYARGLVATNVEGVSNPYCKISVGDQVLYSNYVMGSCNPDWNEVFTFTGKTVTEAGFVCVLESWSKDALLRPDDFCGQCEVDLRAMRLGPIADRMSVKVKLYVLKVSGKKESRDYGYIYLTMWISPEEEGRQVLSPGGNAVASKELLARLLRAKTLPSTFHNACGSLYEEPCIVFIRIFLQEICLPTEFDTTSAVDRSSKKGHGISASEFGPTNFGPTDSEHTPMKQSKLGRFMSKGKSRVVKYGDKAGLREMSNMLGNAKGRVFGKDGDGDEEDDINIYEDSDEEDSMGSFCAQNTRKFWVYWEVKYAKQMHISKLRRLCPVTQTAKVEQSFVFCEVRPLEPRAPIHISLYITNSKTRAGTLIGKKTICMLQLLLTHMAADKEAEMDCDEPPERRRHSKYIRLPTVGPKFSVPLLSWEMDDVHSGVTMLLHTGAADMDYRPQMYDVPLLLPSLAKEISKMHDLGLGSKLREAADTVRRNSTPDGGNKTVSKTGGSKGGSVRTNSGTVYASGSGFTSQSLSPNHGVTTPPRRLSLGSQPTATGSQHATFGSQPSQSASNNAKHFSVILERDESLPEGGEIWESKYQGEGGTTEGTEAGTLALSYDLHDAKSEVHYLCDPSLTESALTQPADSKLRLVQSSVHLGNKGGMTTPARQGSDASSHKTENWSRVRGPNKSASERSLAPTRLFGEADSDRELVYGERIAYNGRQMTSMEEGEYHSDAHTTVNKALLAWFMSVWALVVQFLLFKLADLKRSMRSRKYAYRAMIDEDDLDNVEMDLVPKLETPESSYSRCRGGRFNADAIQALIREIDECPLRNLKRSDAEGHYLDGVVESSPSAGTTPTLEPSSHQSAQGRSFGTASTSMPSIAYANNSKPDVTAASVGTSPTLEPSSHHSAQGGSFGMASTSMPSTANANKPNVAAASVGTSPTLEPSSHQSAQGWSFRTACTNMPSTAYANKPNVSAYANKPNVAAASVGASPTLEPSSHQSSQGRSFGTASTSMPSTAYANTSNVSAASTGATPTLEPLSHQSAQGQSFGTACTNTPSTADANTSNGSAASTGAATPTLEYSSPPPVQGKSFETAYTNTPNVTAATINPNNNNSNNNNSNNNNSNSNKDNQAPSGTSAVSSNHISRNSEISAITSRPSSGPVSTPTRPSPRPASTTTASNSGQTSTFTTRIPIKSAIPSVSFQLHPSSGPASPCTDANLHTKGLPMQIHTKPGGGGKYPMRHGADTTPHDCHDTMPAQPQADVLPIGSINVYYEKLVMTLPNVYYFCLLKVGPQWIKTAVRKSLDETVPTWEFRLPVYEPSVNYVSFIFYHKSPNPSPSEIKLFSRAMFPLSAIPPNRLIMRDVNVEMDKIAARDAPSSPTPHVVHLKLQCTLVYPDWGELGLTYKRPLHPPAWYTLNMDEHDAYIEKQYRKAIERWLQRSNPPVPAYCVKLMLKSSREKFDFDLLMANMKRVWRSISGILALGDALQFIMSWDNPYWSVFCILVFGGFCLVPSAAVSLMLAWTVLVAHGNRTQAGSLPGQKKKTDEDSDDDVDAPSRNHLPASQLKRQYDGVIRVALVVQNLLDDIATAFERFGTLMQWKDPVATMIFMAVCSAISIAFYLLGMSVLLAIVGAFVLRPPQFRDPEPPAPLAFFSRLPAFRNVKLPSHKSPSNNGRTEN